MYIPDDLGKIIYQDSKTSKELIRDDLPSNIFCIFFSSFGIFLFFGVIYYKLYEMILAFDIDKYLKLFEYLSLPRFIFKITIDEFEFIFIFIILVFFSFFFELLYSSVKALFRTKLYITCDKGFAVITFDNKNRFKHKTLFYFKNHYELHKKEKSEFRFAGMRTHYHIFYHFLENKKRIYTLHYSYTDKEEFDNSRDRMFCESVVESFERYLHR